MSNAEAQTGRPRPGQASGTERWIVDLSGRTFDLSAKLSQIKASPDPTARGQWLAALLTDTQRDQAAFAFYATQLGATVREQFWMQNLCVVEILPSQLKSLSAFPQVIQLIPDEERLPASRGPAGVQPLQVGGIDCNDATQALRVDPWCPMPGNFPSAPHGSGVAAVAVGTGDNLTPPRFFEGHAPQAQLLSFSISEPQAQPTQTWTTSTTKYLDAIQALQTWILAVPGRKVHALNISYDGWSDPDHITQYWLDVLEREYDILVVTSAANDGDATFNSNGFLNGLSVGNVHKYLAGKARYPHRFSSRGPLAGDPDRIYPDVCASGASSGTSLAPTIPQIVMPLIDHNYPDPVTPPCRGTALGNDEYNAQGTSFSAPQVTGAAALYRGKLPTASAQETRAAILLATIDPLLETHLPGGQRHTYVERNATGVGYTRDDLLAKYAVRTISGPDLGQNVNLTTLTPSATVNYLVTGGSRYAVAIAWPRVFATGIGWPPAPLPTPHVDLEVLDQSGAIVARSDSPRNTYERLVFTVPGTAQVQYQIRVSGVSLPTQTVPVFVAARSISGDSSYVSKRSISGFVTSVPQESACVHTTQDQTVAWVAPNAYQQAYGSLPFIFMANLAGNVSDAAWTGFTIGNPTSAAYHFMYHDEEVGDPNSPTTIRGIALRSWDAIAPPSTNGPWTIYLGLFSVPATMGSVFQQIGTPTNSPPGNVYHVSNHTLDLRLPRPNWNARRWDTWPIIIPFNDPNNTVFVLPAGHHLGVWMRVVVQSPQTPLYVDGTFDVTDNASARYGSIDAQPGSMFSPGQVPIIGLLTGNIVSTTPLLDAYGFPQWGSPVLFQVRQMPANAPVFLLLGLTNPSAPVGSCRVLTSGDLGTFGFSASPMGDVLFPFTVWNDPAVLHLHVYAQAAHAISPTALLLTNGLRLTIGGDVP